MLKNFNDSPKAKQTDELVEITQLMQRLLKPQGIKVKVEQEEDCLYVLLEGRYVPDQAMMVALVKLSIDGLQEVSLKRVRIYGRQEDNPFTDWIQEMSRSSLKTLVPTHILRAQVESSSIEANVTDTKERRNDSFLVCGLGTLGQHCVGALRSFASSDYEFSITAITLQMPENWEIEELPEWLAGKIVIGDCRRDRVLEQAGIKRCRAILILTSDENVNLETVVAVQRLNPHARVIVRSSKLNLNILLKQKLDNYIAFDPTELPATAFTLAALGEEILGFFNVEGQQLRVVKHQVLPSDYRFINSFTTTLYRKDYLLLGYLSAADSLRREINIKSNTNKETLAPQTSSAFYYWSPNTKVKVGDTLIYLEEVDLSTTSEQHDSTWERWRDFLREFRKGNRRQKLTESLVQIWNWIYLDQTRRVGVFGLLTATVMGTLGTLLLKFSVPKMSWQSAISSAIILLLGGYGDVFGGLEMTPVPWWVQFLCLMITAVSLLFILSGLGLIADRLLLSRFDFLRRRLPIPTKNHVVLVGFGRVGQRIAVFLQSLGQPFVCLSSSEVTGQDWMPQVPLIQGPLVSGLSKVNLSSAKSVIVVTEDQMVNLEIALMAREMAGQSKHHINLVIRTDNQRFNDHLGEFLSDLKALCVYALSAEAFAAAAFGENIFSLFRLFDSTILVTEYCIIAGDTLNERLLSQVAYGYGVVPIYYQASRSNNFQFMPSDDTRLQEGDRLIVLASTDGLQRIEWGIPCPPRLWLLQALKPLSTDALFDAGNLMENITGCSLKVARSFMDNLPGVLSVPGVMELELYDHQAYHLVEKLRRFLPVRLVAVTDPTDLSSTPFIIS